MAVSQMDFGGVKAEPRVIRRARIILQYLFDSHQQGQLATKESAVR